MPLKEFPQLLETNVIVTGARGLGREAANVFQGPSNKVIVTATKLQVARDRADELRSQDGVHAFGLDLEVLDEASIRTFFERALEIFDGRIDVLIHYVGGNRDAAKLLNLQQFREAAFWQANDEVLRVNLIGAQMVTGMGLSCMAEQNITGSIITIGSIGALPGNTLSVVPSYCVAKAGNFTWTQCLANEAQRFGHRGLRVNEIVPGFFPQEQNRRLLQNTDGTPTERGKAILDHTPMKRYGDPKDLSGAVLYLASPELSGFVTGERIIVAGGFDVFSGV